jgi:hypothetical protein
MFVASQSGVEFVLDVLLSVDHQLILTSVTPAPRERTPRIQPDFFLSAQRSQCTLAATMKPGTLLQQSFSMMIPNMGATLAPSSPVSSTSPHIACQGENTQRKGDRQKDSYFPHRANS